MSFKHDLNNVLKCKNQHFQIKKQSRKYCNSCWVCNIVNFITMGDSTSLNNK